MISQQQRIYFKDFADGALKCFGRWSPSKQLCWNEEKQWFYPCKPEHCTIWKMWRLRKQRKRNAKRRVRS